MKLILRHTPSRLPNQPQPRCDQDSISHHHVLFAHPEYLKLVKSLLRGLPHEKSNHQGSRRRKSSPQRSLTMAVTSSLFYFFIAITVCTLVCGFYVVAEKLCGSLGGLRFKKTRRSKVQEAPKPIRGRGDEEVNVVRQGGPSVV